MNNSQLLARIKLRETERQRDRLHGQYDAIEARTAAAGSALERLRALHQGLRAVTFAQKPLHPEVVNLDALYLADALGTVPPELIADRTRLLERELAQGRLRAEFTYAFGRILSEAGVPSTDPVDAAEDPLASLWEAPPTLDRVWLDATLAAQSVTFEAVAAEVGEFARSDALAPVRSDEVTDALQLLRHDIYALPSFRRQAGELLRNEALLNECAGALTILLNSLDDWDWPEAGCPVRAAWVRVKHRPHVDEDVITALFLQLVGLRWSRRLKPLLIWRALRDGKDPLFPPEPPTALTAEVQKRRLDRQAVRFLARFPEDPQDPQSVSPMGYYGPDALLGLLVTVEAEIRFARAAFPERPLYVVQADLRDFYNALSHELILIVLARLGVPERWLRFFERFLRPPLRYRGQTRRPARGMPLEHLLADLFAECALLVLDLHLWRNTRTQLLRVVDDLWFFADSAAGARAAWAEVQAFCRASGLAVNEPKSGAVCVGDESAALDGLPAGRPRWGLLRLQSDRTWQVDEAAFTRLEGTIRRDLSACPTVLSLVSCYNRYVEYALGQTAPSVPLEGEHARRVAGRLMRTHEGLFGGGGGVVEEVNRRLSSCFADARLKERGLPHALLYWPITAGGLALAHPLLHVATYLADPRDGRELRIPERAHVAAYLWGRSASVRKSPLSPGEAAVLIWRTAGAELSAGLTAERLASYLQQRDSPRSKNVPDDEEIDLALASAWGAYYDAAVAANTPTGPVPLPAMERLVSDFVNRGTEVAGRYQEGLTPYWRWVVYTYGPSLLEALGTFRFLLTELVPVQLILEQRGGTAPDEPNPASASADELIPF